MNTKINRPAREVLKERGIEDPTMASILKTHRQCEELTQAQLAKKLKISVSHLSDIENKRKFVSIERAREFAKRLQQSESYFIMVVLRELLKRANCDYHIELRKSKAG